ncbi:MAG: amidohydrolase family protein [Candidatus Brocadiaceae bacterium]|nr:amidohydrolase family protein [Candidatus Brocadiaceae bacterium]
MYILRSKYLLKDPDTEIENGAVLISEDGNIEYAGPFTGIKNKESFQVVDLGNAVIAPGFVNTHTHLELTHLHNCINYNGTFTDWIRQLVNIKQNWSEEDYRSSVADGIMKSIESGTTMVVDITRNCLALDELIKNKIRKTLFFEIIDFNPDNASNTIDNFKNQVDDILHNDLLTIGIFPHAPYTVSEELYKKCKNISNELEINIATHISETEDEVEFLNKGTGSFVSLLNDFDMLNNWKPPGQRPIYYLKNIGILEKGCILIHCNFLTDNEIDIIEKSESSVVFCPRSHRYFQHGNHPFLKLREHKLNIALGTDSLASNDSLSILDEMKFISEHYNDVRPQEIFYMGTIAGAKALGMDDKIGRLEPGYYADIAVVEFDENFKDNIYDGVFSKSSVCTLTMVSGKICYDKNKLVPSGS